MSEIAAAAHAVQANVVSLRVAWCRQLGYATSNHDIKTPPPGPVKILRNFLINRHVIKSYSQVELHLRLRQVWGEFCTLCWLFPYVDPQCPIDFSDLPPAQTTRCPTDMLTKLDEIQKDLWRIRHEQRRRHDREACRDPTFQKEDEVAQCYIINIYGEGIRTCPDEKLLDAACEYAGMLAAIRWASDNRWEWEGPGIMNVALGDDNQIESHGNGMN